MLLYIYLFVFISTLLFYIFNKKIEIYNFGKKTKNSINIIIIGGTHGNEPSSSLSLYKLINYLKTKSIRNSYITIIPMLNKTGFYTNNRYSNHFLNNYDINRNYPKKYYINSYITDIIENYDIIIDHHEGYNYHISNKDSIGSTLTPVNFRIEYIKKIISNLNNYITDKNKWFTINSRDKFPDGSLRDLIYKNFSNKKYLLIETTGITNRDALHERQFKALYLIISILLDKNVIRLHNHNYNKKYT